MATHDLKPFSNVESQGTVVTSPAAQGDARARLGLALTLVWCMSEADLRRIGRARFDNLEVIWDYDSAATLMRLRVPLLWVLAGEDREAPIATTQALLSGLIAQHRPISAYVFPQTDHGIMEFRTDPDGTRVPTRITEGYLRLLADWIKGEVRGSYGRSITLN